MKYLIKVYQRLLVDICLKSGVSLDAPEEISEKWVLNEGPLLDKQLLRYIEGDGQKPSPPEWLEPLFDKFYETKSPITLRLLRETLVFCYKAEQLPSNEQLSDAQKAFEETDDTCGLWSRYFFSSGTYSHLLASARRIVGSIIYRIDWSEITPSHGPGAVYPSRKPWEKSKFRTFYPKINERYPYDQYYCGLPNYWWDVIVDGDKDMLVEDKIVANLVAVPKDSRGPRLICVHPAESIWIQQGQRRLLEARILSHPLTRGKISFKDQSINGNIALTSSSSREFVTLDLKEASDRISTELVQSLFGDYAYSWLSCSRATHCKLLDGRVIELKKWAPMGNALTFPVESLVFFSLVVAGIRSRYGVTCNDVYVFGDDIIFPREYYDGVITALVWCGLVPNHSKTFVNGFFRESCGVDAYLGVNVTPLRARKGDIITLDAIISYLDLAKRLRLDGYDSCSSFIYTSVRKRLGYLPLVNNPCAQGLVEYVNSDLGHLLLLEPSAKWHKATQQWVIPHRTVTQPTVRLLKDDWYHLQDSLLRLTLMGDSCSDRGTEYPIPYRTRLTYGWTPIAR